MSKLHKTLLASALFVAMSSQALAECASPSGPIIPDGNVASKDELIAAQKAMKAFQGKLGEYRECIDGMNAEVVGEDEASVQKKAALNAAYDASIEKEEAIAEEFNQAVRAYKNK